MFKIYTISEETITIKEFGDIRECRNAFEDMQLKNDCKMIATEADGNTEKKLWVYKPKTIKIIYSYPDERVGNQQAHCYVHTEHSRKAAIEFIEKIEADASERGKKVDIEKKSLLYYSELCDKMEDEIWG